MEQNDHTTGGFQFSDLRYSGRGYGLRTLAGIPPIDQSIGSRRSYSPALGRDKGTSVAQLSSWSSTQTLTNKRSNFSEQVKPQHRQIQSPAFLHRTESHFNFTSGPQSESQRSHRSKTGSVKSHQSLRSDRSKDVPLDYRGTSDRGRDKGTSADSGVVSHISSWSSVQILSSEHPEFSELVKPQHRQIQSPAYLHRTGSHFTPGSQSESQRSHRSRTGSVKSHQSLRSDRSKDDPLDFRRTSDRDKDLNYSSARYHLSATFERLDQDIVTFVKDQLKSFQKTLASDDCVKHEDYEKQSSREAFLNITMNFLKTMNQGELAEQLHKKFSAPDCSQLRRHMQQTFGRESLPYHFETKLTITHRENSQTNEEHIIKLFSGKPTASMDTIPYKDIFKDRSFVTKGSIRTVVTKGASGIGKTVLTQKFILDWAEGKINQDIHLLFPFTFRELNLLKDKHFSLVELLHHCFPEFQGLSRLENLLVLFIFDGLDECRFHLDFEQAHLLTDVTECVSVDKLLVSLIRGTLLPSSRIWITTRPTEFIEIPTWCISMMTEVQGFTEPQKEQYFRKMFRDEQQGTIVISHIKTSHSLQEMSHIPGFCWILSKVFHYFMEAKATKLPQTLTEMYIFLLALEVKVVKRGRLSEITAHWTPEIKKMVEFLGKLAFDQLQKGHTVFYESDLIEMGITLASDCMQMFKGIFREEQGLHKDKVYSFVHLSVLEFLAALHVHLTFINSGVNLLTPQQISECHSVPTTNTSQRSFSHKLKLRNPFKRHSSKPVQAKQSTECPEVDFYLSAVDLFLQSTNEPLDLFWRFLFGLSHPNNQSLLHGLFTRTLSMAQTKDITVQQTVQYIEDKLDKGPSAEKSWDLLHCLFELQDHRLVEDMQQLLNEGQLIYSKYPISWSALVYLLMSSHSNRNEFDLRDYGASEEGLLNLMPVITVSIKAKLSCCNLSQSSCDSLSSVLCSSILRHLDLSNNDFGDSGVELLSFGLNNGLCRLQTLRLSGCLITEEGGTILASALRSATFHLTELDMRYNHPGQSAEQLKALQDGPHSLVDSVKLLPVGERWMVFGLMKYFHLPALDPNTLNSNLQMNATTVQYVKKNRKYPNHPHRFTDHPQVLSSTGLTECCFWKVNWSGQNDLDIAVSYRGISREGTGPESMFGENSQSWSMRIMKGHYSFCHNGAQRQLHFDEKLLSGTVGVFLDYEAGSLSFYEIPSTGQSFHLYTFKTKFTEPLFLGFGVYTGSSLTLI